VLGSALIILGGSAFAGSEKAQPAMSRILAVRPLQWIGTMSYSWYLWHWPFIILAMVMFDTDALWLQVAAGAAALAAAALTYYKVENPLRYSARLRTSVKRTFVVTGTALAAAALLGSATLAVGIHLERTSLRHLATVRAAVPGDNLCPENVQMSPKKIQYCVYGDTESARTVFLVGDSHAGQWRDALAAAAKDEGIMLVTRWKASCPAVPARVALEGGSGPDAACAKYQAKSFALMKELQPNGVVVAQAAFYDVRVRDEQGMQPTSEEGRLNIWLTAYRQFIDRVSETGAAVAVIEDNPEMRRDPLRCLARFGNSESDCAPTRGEALETVSAIQAAEANILQRPEIKDVFGTIDKICDATRCRLLDGDTIIFRDTDHLSREWTLNQQARLEELLASIS
jgi:hypothetical protein